MDALPLLFKRSLDDHQMMFAMGEAIAHLHYLEWQGKVERLTDAGGVRRFLRRGQARAPLAAVR